MTRLRLATPRSCRRGFTLIELLVVISIIAVLMSLIAPAVQNARRAARRAQCMNNMHNLAIAVQNFASTNNAQLPPLSGTLTVGDVAGTSSQFSLPVSWVVPLLPLMDMSALYRSIREGSTQVGSTSVATLKPIDQVYIPMLACPEDIGNFNRPLGLSYAANAGYINATLWAADPNGQHDLYTVDYDKNGHYIDATGAVTGSATATDLATDATAAVATGVFWRQRPAGFYAAGIPSGSEPRCTLDSIAQGDGMTQTLMFAENLNSTNWSSYVTGNIAFGIAVTPTGTGTSAAFSGGITSPLWAPQPPASGNFGDVTSGSVTYHSAQINSQPLTISGIPRPSSAHLGAVNVVLCDGSTRSLNDTVDQTVYIRLLTPDGKTYGQPIVSANNY
jgi:prepilin-type N-terminal cleavage/methylation domain-containing protein